MKLSTKDKCWQIANIEKVFVPFSGLILLAMIGTYTEHKNEMNSFLDILGLTGTIILLISGVYAIKLANKIANYARDNFEEVVSRSTKWRKSTVELHELKYRYMMERFGWAFFVIYAPIFSIVWLTFYNINF